jgi:hypothetical protein
MEILQESAVRLQYYVGLQKGHCYWAEADFPQLESHSHLVVAAAEPVSPVAFVKEVAVVAVFVVAAGVVAGAVVVAVVAAVVAAAVVVAAAAVVAAVAVVVAAVAAAVAVIAVAVAVIAVVDVVAGVAAAVLSVLLGYCWKSAGETGYSAPVRDIKGSTFISNDLLTNILIHDRHTTTITSGIFNSYTQTLDLIVTCL